MLYNTLWLRFIAVFIDNLFLLPLVLLGGSGADKSFSIVAAMVILLDHSYFIIGHAQYGRTIGKRLMGLKVVSAHKHLPITWMQAIQRELMWILLSIVYTFFWVNPENFLTMLPGMALITADTMLAAIHPQNRSLRDFIARTVVIRHRDIQVE
ncbi:MAG: RDD family protein [Chitinophagaceae bacterium]|nr:RDD family protein [Chitinophagaceae bacterium]